MGTAGRVAHGGGERRGRGAGGGAALVAGVTIGDWASMEEATSACVRSSLVFDPEPARTRMYRDFFAIYRGLYDQLRELFVAGQGVAQAGGGETALRA